ncbi:hypothetical protein KJ953_03940 [Patescibacteria group bacterium]|nr:hypothetical protein [Patescibacteria group bacterium]
MSQKKLVIEYIPFPYQTASGRTQDIFKPYFDLKLSYGGKISPTISALVDSGADRSLFPAYIGEMVGIKIKTNKTKITVGGINSKITAYRHKLYCYVGTTKLSTDIDFSYDTNSILLGRKGFFNLFSKIVFQEKKHLFELYY